VGAAGQDAAAARFDGGSGPKDAAAAKAFPVLPVVEVNEAKATPTKAMAVKSPIVGTVIPRLIRRRRRARGLDSEPIRGANRPLMSMATAVMKTRRANDPY
jgi:hypothetical protein